MTHSLVISIRLYDGRYHGASEWPPAPARLFQALIAGAGLSGPLENFDRDALEWLEQLDPPVIGAPRKSNGQSITLYVPNNDLDSVGGDLSRIAEIRGSQKTFKPRLFDSTITFVYAWRFREDQESAVKAATLMALAERMYQFGRGIDFACAWGELLNSVALEERLLAYPGKVYRPSVRGRGLVLNCPTPGSFKSLDDRYRASGHRFRAEQRGRSRTQVFTKLPMPRFVSTAYDSPTSNHVFELCEPTQEARFAVWPLTKISRLVEVLRDAAAGRLHEALPSKQVEIDKVLVGRKPADMNDAPASQRVRILPLPSVGHHYADRGIRRVLIQVPPRCPLRAEDVVWAFSGSELADPSGGEALWAIVTPAVREGAKDMLVHYGIDIQEGYYRWRTVTPAALPEPGGRRRIDPKHRLEDAKNAHERLNECARAAGSVVQALRHIEIRTSIELIRVQREPFEAKGERIEMFAEGTRFSKHRLWHVEIEFRSKVSGPLTIGDGRFLGLGIMAPVRDFGLDLFEPKEDAQIEQAPVSD